MKIELVDAISHLEDTYRGVVRKMIEADLITLKEWNSKLKTYRDDCGYSIIHYFEAYNHKAGVFVTINPIMLDNREELEKRFGVKIRTPEELTKEIENDDKRNNRKEND